MTARRERQKRQARACGQLQKVAVEIAASVQRDDRLS
jgi:hypothetical protein